MDISTEIYFLQALTKYVDEKPYTMRYVPESPLTASNVIREKQTVKVKDVRGIEDQYSLDRNGFMVAKLATKMSYSDFGDSSLITARYLKEVREMLRSIFPSAEIDFASYLIRRRDESFPRSTGQQYDFGQPNIVAHVDTTPADFRRQVRNRYGNRSDKILRQQCQYITIWKPLKGPLYDWPLALCDSATVNPETDFEPQDIVDLTEVLENIHVYYKDSHKWCYLSGQQDDEVLVFRQAGILPDRLGTPHCAISNPKAPSGTPFRESIEVVAFVYNTALNPQLYTEP